MKKTLTYRILALMVVCAWSVLGYALQPNPVVYETDIVGCDNELIYWHCNYYTPTSGVYELYDTVPASNGTDSVTHTTFRIYPSYKVDESVSICPGDTFLWRNRPVYQAGVYADTLSTVVSGCDSIFTLTVSFLPLTPPDTLRATICYQDTYDWQGTHYADLTPGDYTFFSRYTPQGECETYHMLSLHVLPAPVEVDTFVYLCPGDAFTWEGPTLGQGPVFSEPGLYAHVAKMVSSHGCDSLFYNLHVIQRPEYHDTTQVTVTAAQLPYAWHGQLLTHIGTYTRDYTTIHGCDSTFVLYFDVTSSQYDTLTLCNGETYLWNNQLLSQSGDYTAHLISPANGGDSTAYLHLTILPLPYAKQDEVHVLCPGETFTYNGRVYSEAGTYMDTVRYQSFPCDSVYTYIILSFSDTTAVVYPQVTRYDTDPCYQWHGQSLCDPGTYQLYEPNADGCSVRHSISMQVFHVVDTTLYVESDGTTDTYTFIFLGRDTTITLGVTKQLTYVVDVPDPTVVDTIYEVHIKIFGLQLETVYAPDLCPEEGVDFLIQYTTVNNVQPRRYSVGFSDEAKAQGFMDVMDSRIASLDHVLFSQHFNKDFFPAAGTYKATFYLGNGLERDTANMSSMPFTFNVLYPSWFAEQHWNDLLAVLSADATANILKPEGYSFTEYQWYRNGLPVDGATAPMLTFAQSPLLLMGDDAWSTDDDIQVLLTDSTGRSILTCPFHLRMMSDRPVTQNTYFTVRPTIISRADCSTKVSSTSAGMYAVYDFAGRRLVSGELNVGETTIALPPVAGTYLLHMDTDQAYSNPSSNTIKLIVY